MMQENEMENTVVENTLAEDLSPLNSQPETWGNWNGISIVLRKSSRKASGYTLKNTKVLSEVIPNSHGALICNAMTFFILFSSISLLYIFHTILIITWSWI